MHSPSRLPTGMATVLRHGHEGSHSDSVVESLMPPAAANPAAVDQATISRKPSLHTVIGSDSSFASSEASFSSASSEASFASSHTTDSHGWANVRGPPEAFEKCIDFHYLTVDDEEASANARLEQQQSSHACQASGVALSPIECGRASKPIDDSKHDRLQALTDHAKGCFKLPHRPSRAGAVPHGSTSYSAALSGQPDQSSKSNYHASHSSSTCNARRSMPDLTRLPPALVRQEARKLAYVGELIDITEQLVALIWPGCVGNFPLVSRITGSGYEVPLRYFIQEILKRSRASHSTLQMAMYYCYLAWKSPRGLPKIDGRRMFLASVMLGFKYLQDKNYSAHAWSTISGLPKDDIMATQMEFLDRIDYRLFLHVEEWEVWRSCVDTCILEKRKHNPVPQLPRLILEMKQMQALNEVRRDERRTARTSSAWSDWSDMKEILITPQESTRVGSPPMTPTRTARSTIVPDVGSTISSFLTPPSSPLAAPTTPMISSLSSPDDADPATSTGFVTVNRPYDKQFDITSGVLDTESGVLGHASTSVMPAIVETCSTEIDNDVLDDLSNSDDSTPQCHTWDDEHQDLIDAAEDQAHRRLATRSAKFGCKSTSQSNLHMRRKRSIGRCLDRDVDIGRGGKSKACCPGLSVRRS